MHLDARYHYILTREPKLKTTLVDFLFKCAVEVPLRIDVQNVPRRDVCRTSSLIEENFFVRKDINKPTKIPLENGLKSTILAQLSQTPKIESSY